MDAVKEEIEERNKIRVGVPPIKFDEKLIVEDKKNTIKDSDFKIYDYRDNPKVIDDPELLEELYKYDEPK